MKYICDNLEHIYDTSVTYLQHIREISSISLVYKCHTSMTSLVHILDMSGRVWDLCGEGLAHVSDKYVAGFVLNNGSVINIGG